MKLFEVQEKLPDVKTSSPEAIAKKHGVSLKQIEDQLKKGVKVELEHTKDKATAREIALDHLSEVPNYYDKLSKYVEAVEHTKAKDVPKAKEGYYGNIEKLTLDNNNYRKVLYTTHNTQLVLMNLKPGVEIGSEVHDNGSQFFRIEAGHGIFHLGNKDVGVKDGDSVIVPAGMKHNLHNNSEEDLKVYVLYSPPQHEDGLVQKDRPSED